MSEVNLIGITKPSAYTDCATANELVAWAARVSNPSNQNNTKTAPKLVQYLIKNQHWSPLEMVHVSMEIKTTRDIARQILRHRSFAFQEYSQRYADPKMAYAWATERGIAKEQARAVLPEGCTESVMIMSGSLRSWVHYCQLRMDKATQKEHRIVAEQCWEIICHHFPDVKKALDDLAEQAVFEKKLP